MLELIRTKLQRPRLGQHLILRPHLIELLDKGLHHKLTLISAQAGSGKTTLIVQWLKTRPELSAWLSIDQHDNDLLIFARYLCAAIRTAFPDGCEQVLELLKAPHVPPLRVISTSLVNDLDSLFKSRTSAVEEYDNPAKFFLVLDDYQSITEASIHQLLSNLITYMPFNIHMFLITRTDPPLPLTGLRARSEMSELRTGDLRFSATEAGRLLELTAGRKLGSKTIDILGNKTDGWAVGLRLAGLSLQNVHDSEYFVQRFGGTSSAVIVDYLVNEVLSKLTATEQDFLLRTSILERFSADLCDHILWEGSSGDLGSSKPATRALSEKFIRYLMAANLFLLPVDPEGVWYRYHPLFRDMLFFRMTRQYSKEDINDLNLRASHWFEEHGYIEEALNHAFTIADLERAKQIVSGQRYLLMNQARWLRLDRYLHLFPVEYVERTPDLLILKAWLLYHQDHLGQVPAVIDQLESEMVQSELSTESTLHLRGEISALKSLMSYYQSDIEDTIEKAKFALEHTPTELWIVRILARMTYGGALQMHGDLKRAYDVILDGKNQETVRSNAFTGTMLLTVCNLYWMAADLGSLRQTARQCIELFDTPTASEIVGLAHYHLGCVSYHQNELESAEEHFAYVVNHPQLNYGHALANSACGLGLTYLAQDRPDEANEVASATVGYLIETGNTTRLPALQAFQAEIALRQGRLSAAEQWAARIESSTRLVPMVRFYEPNLTLLKIWLAQDAADSRQKAATFLDRLKNYTEMTHNKRYLIEVMALQSLLQSKQNEQGALELLREAVRLAQPGRFLRLFVDLGPRMHQLLSELNRQEDSEYLSELVAAFQPDYRKMAGGVSAGRDDAWSPFGALTLREMEVLEFLARRRTNREIAVELSVSLATVKSHTNNLYSKLGVHNRRQAVTKARELDLIPPD